MSRRIRAADLGPWLVIGVVAWFGIAWIGWQLWNQDPPRAGFDLTLLLDAARRVLAGQSPYDPAMLAAGEAQMRSRLRGWSPDLRAA